MIPSRHAMKSLLPLAVFALTAKAAEFFRRENPRSRWRFIAPGDIA